jgi:hypothetical protein
LDDYSKDLSVAYLHRRQTRNQGGSLEAPNSLGAIMSETRSAAPHGANSEEQARLVRLETTVHTLVATQQKTKPFFREPAQMVAISAFIISLVTAVHAYFRERSQDEQALKTQLRATIIQAGDIGIKNQELRLQFASNPGSLSELSVWLGVQNSILAHQGYELLSELGANASPSEIQSVANRLESVNQYSKAEDLLKKGLATADNVTEKLALMREMAGLKTVLKAPTEAAAIYQSAIELVSQQKGMPQEYINLEKAYTHWAWGSGLAADHDCAGVKEHLSLAASFLKDAGAAGAATLANQMADAQSWISTNCP